jgi:16S rRNA (cytosine967-C5)-methyltransferase
VKAAPALATELSEAARIVASVAAGASLADELDKVSSRLPASRPALIDLSHGTLRRYGRVQTIVAALSRQGRRDPLVEGLLWCSLYALECGRYQDHTVVDQAVKACGLLERWPAKAYVNALLRNALRRRPAIEARIAHLPEAKYQHPAWWIDELQAAYPQDWEAVLGAGNTHPPMCLRINLRRSDVERYRIRLANAGLPAQRSGAQGLLLSRPLPVAALPGFDAGEISVQDAGAQRAAYCLDLRSGMRVLDACAAPGGKSGHILELADVALTALEVDPPRAARIKPNLERLGLSAQVVVGDAARPEQWWDGKLFDRILADVPCSASGIARRRPDVKWLRRKSDLAGFAERQTSILRALWRLLAPGGKLLYATCSVFPQENQSVVHAFVASEPGARRCAPPDGGPAQWLPDTEHDGFYYALIQKQG